MCIIGDHTNSFAALCTWIRANSIKKLSHTTNTPAIWKNDGIRELSNSITELSNSITELSNSFKDKLN